MSSSKDAIRGSLVVLEAVDAARNTRAFLLFISCAIAALVVAGVFIGIAGTLASNGAFVIGGLFSFIGSVAAAIITATGVSAAGKTLMDQIQGRPVQSARDALIAGLLTLPKLAAIFLIEIAILLAFMIVLAVVLFICKIPFLGPLLYTVVYPIASVIGGIMWFSFMFVVNPLAAPAFWEGYGVRAALDTLGMNRGAFNVGRLLPPIVQQMVLLFVVGIVAFIASTIVFGGSAFVAALASGIIGFGGSLLSLYSGFGFGGMGGMGGMGGGMSGYLLATGVGVGMLGALAYTFPLLVYLAGICNIFLNLAGANAAPPASPDAPVSAAPRPPHAPEPFTSHGPALLPDAPANASPACAACGTRAEPEDAFCGECGADLPRGA
ncbi:MAG TPA: zinc ribbon domain-containing protein [Paraburkholderia sp.]|uniref:zinc ribbon domain-containing protein n=1 Tax=Paraburkholderia sp. TaxID=1926495 RepID=UPI002DE55E73|nr:zinc ribbon domain-containing protein [Paraburkholderia sp.]